MTTRRLAFAICVSLLLLPQLAFGARPIAEVYGNVTQGTFARAANSVMTCDRSRESNGRCNAIESTTGTLQFNNNDTHTAWIDVDGVVDFDGDGADDTFNSSTADLAVPSTATVVWAGLYWHGNQKAGSTNTAPGNTNEVRFRRGTGPYDLVTADWCSTIGERYACFADVLGRLETNSAAATYGVGNITANTGEDDFIGGWELLVVYEDDALPLRSLSVFHGHQTYGGGSNSITFVASGFLTPLMGPISAELGLTVAEGDEGSGDDLTFQSEQSTAATTVTGDLGNATIQDFGTNVTTRNPAFRNTLGHDSDLFDVSSLMVNGDRTATIGLPGSGGEENELIKVDFAVDVYFPLITSTKTVADLNGGDIVVGDTLRYTIEVANDPTALDGAVNVSLTDVLDPSLQFVPGSVTLASTVSGGPAVGPKTDQGGDDIATWDSTLRTLTVNLGSGATAGTGGTIAVGESTSITFEAVVLPSAANTRVQNSALIAFEGATLAGTNFSRVATATSDDPGTQPRDSTDVTPTGDDDDDGLGDSDTDDDNDGIPDIVEGFGVDPSADSDGDGVEDWQDIDTPGFLDFNADLVDDRYDQDGDGIPNHLDLDSDGDGIFDIVEAGGAALDANGDGRIDNVVDADADGLADVVDPSDGGTPFVIPDTDGAGRPNPWDNDDDGDGYLTTREVLDEALYGDDIDGDGVPAWYDIDTDGDGINDLFETEDIDADGIPDYFDPDQSFITSPNDGQVIRSSDFSVTGTTEAGATVDIEVLDGNGTVVDSSTVVADAAGAFSTSFAGLADAPYTVEATATDLGGASYTDTVDVIVATVFLAIDAPADGTVTADSTPALVGRANPNEVVTIVVDPGTPGEQTLTVTANAAGDWFVFLPELADGPHRVTASVDDGAGGTVDAAVDFTVDTTAPALTLDTPADGSATDDPTPTVSGTTDPGAQVDVFVDESLVGTVDADSNGNWSFDVASPLDDGFYTVSAETTDDAGNTSREDATFEVDLTPPGVTIATPVDGSTTGASRPVISGTSEPGAEVQIAIDGAVVATVTADTSGVWTYTPMTPLSDGAYTVEVEATDDAGNRSLPTSSTFTVDSSLPYVQIAEPLDGTAVSTDQPTISGRADAGAMVEISVDGNVVATVAADANGDWSHTLATGLADGSHDVTATVTDGANTASDEARFEVDTMAPTLSITTPQAGDIVPSRPTVTGTAEPGATIVVVLPDGSQTRTVADSNGDWSVITEALPDGMNTITVTASDSAGNETTDSVDVFVDATPPTVKIDNPDDNATKNDPLEPFQGTTSEPNAEVVLVLDGAEIARVTSDADGNWSYVPTAALSEGLHTLRAEVTDSVGNRGADTVDFIIDTRAPDVTISSPAENEEVTVARPTFTGTAPPNSSVAIFIDGQKVADVTADANGDWVYTAMTDLADGPHRVIAQTRDAAGNVGDDEVYFEVDTVPPFVAIDSPADGATVGVTSPAVSGSTKPGELVEVFLDGVKVGETTADANGDFSFMLSGLAEATYTVETRVDGASDAHDFDVDLTAPTVSIDSPADGDLTNDSTPTVSGTAEPGAVVEIFVDGVKVGETTADMNGDWTFDVGELADGDHEIEAVATDAGGNSASSGVVTVTIDTEGPELTVDSPQDGDSAGDGTTVGGTAEPGSTIEIFVDGEKVGETTADENGDWEVEIDNPGEGQHDIVVVAADPAGNTTEVGPITVIGEPIASNNGTGNNSTGNNGTGNNGTGNNDPGGGGEDDDAFTNSYLEGGCSAAGGALPVPALLVVFGLLLLGMVRRRPAARA